MAVGVWEIYFFSTITKTALQAGTVSLMPFLVSAENAFSVA